VGGALKVRNWQDNILTRMQAIEYMLSMQLGKTGMANWGVLNNISGAFGGFRRKILNHIGGWDTHTAEDLDLTVRLKQYKRRYPKTKLAFSPHAVGHTDVPSTIKGLIQQRLRWDGDLLFLYLRKHNKGLTTQLGELCIYTCLWDFSKYDSTITRYYLLNLYLYVCTLANSAND
ncbi:glycosyltransferase, partial [Psychrobacter sp. Ps6]|uniref:glycosyltransferase family 2 protein n=1 Tax=Psychrobacter sp. Ps6 TaxID=2790960 RepID=UPI001EDD0546